MLKRRRNRLLAALAAGATLAALCAAAIPAQAAPRSPAGGPGRASVLAWGENNFEQLGYPAVPDHTLPRNVVPAATGACDAANMRSIRQISAGAWSSMALLSDGVVCSWGRNDFGQLGQDRVSGPVLTPGPVCAPYWSAPYSARRQCNPLRATAIATGGLFGLAIVPRYQPNSSVTLTDAVVSFGSAMTGELGTGRTFTTTDVPELVCGIVGTPTNGPVCPRTDTLRSDFLHGAKQISAGEYDSMALVRGHAVGWGDNTSCQLGVGNDCTLGLNTSTGRGPYGPGPCLVLYTESQTNCSPDPVTALTAAATPVSGVMDVSAGNGIDMVLLDSGRVMVYGSNYYNMLGNGLTGLTSPDTCFNNNTRSPAQGFGCSWYARYVVGNREPKSPCYARKDLSGVTAISAGFTDALALLKDGRVCDWGFGTTYGNLGDGNVPSVSARPVAVCAIRTCAPGRYLTGITAISAGLGANNLALFRGRVVTWGDNQSGEQGQDTLSTGVDPPRLVCTVGPAFCPNGPYLIGITQISAGAFHDLASP